MFKTLTVAEDNGQSDRVSFQYTSWSGINYVYSSRLYVSFTFNRELIIKSDLDNGRPPIMLEGIDIEDIDQLIECLQDVKQVLSENLLAKKLANQYARRW